MRLVICVLGVSLGLAAAGCGQPLVCGSFLVERDGTCACPEGTEFLPEERACRLLDGGIVYLDDGGAGDAGGADGGMRDASFDAPPPDGCEPTTFYRDTDADGFGDGAMSIQACAQPAGFVANADDCDDTCASCHPDGAEMCDTLDNDCDERVDETVTPSFYRDADSDGYGDPLMPMLVCARPTGYVDNDDDCDDSCAGCVPGGTELCDGRLDQDCDGTVDNGCRCTIGASRDCPGGTDVGACIAGTQMCGADGEWGACTGAVGPVAETCNGQDDDCNMTPDDGAASTSCGSVSRATGVGCSAGACFVTSCSGAWRDCDRMFANGCETQTGTVAACASCGDTCGWDCEDGGCNDGTLVRAALRHTCALRESGAIVCWGDSAQGQLGYGLTTGSASPVAVTGLVASSFDASGSHSCAVTAGGAVRCWGQNTAGQLGDGTMMNQLSPVAVSAIVGAQAVATGDSHTCALLSSGVVRCWGEGRQGQLGHEASASSLTPVSVASLTGVQAITAGALHTCALLAAGTVWCWGDNTFGQLGNGSNMPSNRAVMVSGLTGVQSIDSGGFHTCAVLATGAVSCWGQSENGELGNGMMANSNVPVAVTGLTGATAISASRNHTCAVVTGGGVRCWGQGMYGQLGNGLTSGSSTPVTVGMLSDAISVSVGLVHSCAVRANGGVVCWGDSPQGQLGDGTLMQRLVPTAVLAP